MNFHKEILDHFGIAKRKGAIVVYVNSAIRAFAVSFQNALDTVECNKGVQMS